MKILDTGFPIFDRIMRFFLIVNVAGILMVILLNIIESNMENTKYSMYLENPYGAIMRISIFIILAGFIYDVFFIKRCKVCRRRLDGEYLLAENRTKQVNVCKKCFDSPDVWEKYFKIYGDKDG